MLVLAAVLAKGHVLLEDFPGLGKTLAARSFAQALGPRLRARAVHPRPAAGRPDRVVPLRPARRRRSSSAAGRCSPGCCWPTRSTGRRPRPSRRCSRRCRSGRSPSRARPSRCPSPFHVLATANPIEYEGTYPLPEAQLDRFLLRVSFGYPTARRGVRRARPPAGAAAGGGRRSTQVTDARRRCSRCRPRSRRSPSTRASAATASTWPSPPATTPTCSPAPRRAARSGLVLAARALRRAARPRLRHPRGRQGGRPLGARAPDHGQARALDDRRPAGAGSSTRCCSQVPTPVDARAARVTPADDAVASRPPALGRALVVGAAARSAARCCSASPCWSCWPRRCVVLRGARAGAPARRASPGRAAPASTTSRSTRARAPARGWTSTDADGVEHVTRDQRAGAVRRPAPGGGPRRRAAARRRPGAGGQPAALGAADARRGEGRADQPVGGLPLGAGARARRGDERAAGVGAVRLARRGAAAARPGRRAPVAAGRATAPSSPGIRPFHAGRPAAPDQLAGLAAHRRAARRDHPRPRRTAACCSSSTRWPTSARSGGVDGAASSLDLTMRAASALAEHHVRTGDRVALRVVGAAGRAGRATAPGAGTCGGSSAGWPRVRPARLRDDDGGRLQPAARPAARSSSCCRRCWPRRSARPPRPLHRRGLPVLVVDTLPERRRGRSAPEGTDPLVADLAWRMRRIEREQFLDRLAREGCPVVAVARARAPSTTCCTGWPGAPSCPRCGSDDVRLAGLDPGPVAAAGGGRCSGRSSPCAARLAERPAAGVAGRC